MPGAPEIEEWRLLARDERSVRYFDGFRLVFFIDEFFNLVDDTLAHLIGGLYGVSHELGDRKILAVIDQTVNVGEQGIG